MLSQEIEDIVEQAKRSVTPIKPKMADNPDQLEEVIHKSFKKIMDPLNKRLEDLDLRIAGTNHSINPLRMNTLFSIRPPALFTGSIGESFSEWLEKFNQFMTIQGITDNEEDLKKALLEQNLSGSARASFREKNLARNAPRTYADCVTQLRVLFPEGKDSDVYQNIIFDKKQAKSDTVMEYVNQLKKIARMAYPELDERAKDGIIKPIFIRGLRNERRQVLKFREFANLADAVKTACYAENQLSRDEMYKTSTIFHNSDTMPGKFDFNTQQILKKIELLEKLMDKQTKCCQVCKKRRTMLPINAITKATPRINKTCPFIIFITRPIPDGPIYYYPQKNKWHTKYLTVQHISKRPSCKAKLIFVKIIKTLLLSWLTIKST